MIKNLIVLFLALPTLLVAQEIRHTEMLGRPSDHSITLQAFFDTTIEMSVRYGTSSGNYTSQLPWLQFSSFEPAEMILDGLQANTKYFYQLLYRLPGASSFLIRPEYTFHTQRAIGSDFTFIVQADPHLDESSDTALYRLCLRNQLEDQPDFMIDLGDFLMSDKLRTSAHVIPHDTVPFRCHLLRSYYETQSHSVPLYIAIGNHEGETGWYQDGTSENVAIWGTTERKKYFINPAPNDFYSGDTIDHPFVGLRENYYAWTWGDALFIVLDPYWYTSPKPDSLTGWRWTLGETQYKWLSRTLESSQSHFKFVFSHQIVGGDAEGRGGSEASEKYEWGGDNLDGTPGFAENRPGWYKPIRDVLEENKATIFFHGHDHFFGKQERNCLIYQETPQPSLPNFQTANMAAEYGYFEGQILPNAGHLRVHVSSNEVQVEYVRAYLPEDENGNRHNKDVSASYTIGINNCYDSLFTEVPIVWNSMYADELVYPNPFREETIISFSIPQADKIDVYVFDQEGRKIRTLIEHASLQKGGHQIHWDGTNDQGLKSKSGVYWFMAKGESGMQSHGKIIFQQNSEN